MKGDPSKKNRNYFLEGSSLVVAQASSARWVFSEPMCISVLADTVVRGCVRLQWIFFGRLLTLLSISMMGNTPKVSVRQFLTKNSTTPMPHPPCSLDLAQSDFFLLPWWKKSSKGIVLPMWKRWNKNSRNTEKHQNQWVQKTVLSIEMEIT